MAFSHIPPVLSCAHWLSSNGNRLEAISLHQPPRNNAIARGMGEKRLIQDHPVKVDDVRILGLREIEVHTKTSVWESRHTG